MSADDIRRIFQRILDSAGVGAEVGAEVGADSNFFDLGGDSLLATRVLSAIARQSGVELGFEDLLSAPTPALLAKRANA